MREPLAIVGIGASAGGLEALELFFTQMPPDTGIAFVLITHMDPAQKGLLPEILRRFTAMPVRETEDGMTVEADTVYVKPAAADLSIFHGTIGHLEPVRTHGMRMPIDGFFQHLAEDQNGKAIGIVLSGTGSDGTLGIRAVKERTGMVMAQDPDSAQFTGMPESAIATGLVDYIAPAERLPELLVQYVKFSITALAGEQPATARIEAELRKIFTLIRLQSGQDFSQYKRSTIRRRIERRMAIHQIPSIGEYVRFLQENPHEIEILASELLIGVTRFFRDPEAWDTLQEEVISDLIPAKPEGSVLRAWVVGCSTGEEAYSMAIVLRECLDALERPDMVQIFATDVDRRAIETARHGIYPANIAADISPGRLERFFVKEDGRYRIRKEIRDSVIFATQNVISDPPFTHLDILSCRNLLIYLSADLQKRLIPLFQYALNPGGYLFLGTAESVAGSGAAFRTVESRWKIFQRRDVTPPQAPRLELPAVLTPPAAAEPKTRDFAREEEAASELAREWLLQEFAPPAVIVNENGDIFYFHGRTGRYLEPGPGRATLNVFAMAKGEIRDALESVLDAAVREKQRFVQKGVSVRGDGGERRVLLTARPVGRRAGRGEMLYSIVFQDLEEPPGEPAPKEAPDRDTPGNDRMTPLEQELAETRARLQYTIEDMQASREELTSMNEELQSTNEELQSTNEELTSSKEELQSLNEELLTVNAEHQKKIEELSETHDDMQNLLRTTRIPILFLDEDLRVRRFTDPIRPIINLQSGDVGRPVTDLAVNLKDERLRADVREVLDSLQVRTKQVQTRDGRWFEMRIVPYRTEENRIEGVVVTFIDIAPLKDLESSLRRARTYAESVVATVHEPLAVLDADLRIVSANRSFSTLFRLAPGEAEGHLLSDLGNRQWDTTELRRLLEEVASGQTEIEGSEVGIGRRRMRLSARSIRPDAGPGLILLAVEDVSGRPASG
ncbi:PAS domain-containing protein [Methanoculleus sp. FWC-SCC1]|uniref:protein-glutamate O-methyltransferase n=2 Tax=Methanoculleus frigidifontis TaxID=2584085 RepID=A0ABT8M821_9EURY|nr:PAS domain-containing protein [Methanoculleus sp. FWC-SCC1]